MKKMMSENAANLLGTVVTASTYGQVFTGLALAEIRMEWLPSDATN
jgi:hypothetical protein